MMCTLDVAWKSAQVSGGARGYEAAGFRRAAEDQFSSVIFRSTRKQVLIDGARLEPEEV